MEICTRFQTIVLSKEEEAWLYHLLQTIMHQQIHKVLCFEFTGPVGNLYMECSKKLQFN